MAEVVLKDVTKKYGETEAVRNLNLECRDGEFMVLLGPSGAGKTSTLKMIAGLESITKGEILIGDRPVNALEPRQRKVAMVFENYALYPHLSVYENIASPLKAIKLSRAEVDAKVRSIAGMLQIAHLLDRKPAQLSGGQQQRVSFGRALIKDAQVYLMDEPLSHLDAKLRHEMRAELKRIHQEVGVTTIYVTHDFSEALALGDRVAILHKGVLQQIGLPDEVYQQPANEFVADIVGEPPMNILRCRLGRSGAALRFVGEGFALPVPDRLAPALSAFADAQEIKIGIRPTQIKVDTSEGRPGALKAEVYVVEPLGGITVLTAKIGPSLIKIRMKQELKADIGDAVYLAFDPDKIRVFDGITGQKVA